MKARALLVGAFVLTAGLVSVPARGEEPPTPEHMAALNECFDWRAWYRDHDEPHPLRCRETEKEPGLGVSFLQTYSTGAVDSSGGATATRAKPVNVRASTRTLPDGRTIPVRAHQRSLPGR